MNGTSLEKKKKGFALPDTYVIVAILVIFMALMTYVIPAGVFDTVTNESGQTMVDPNSFHFVERTSTSLKDLLFSFYTGLKNNATMIFFVMLVGGYIEIALETTAIQRGLRILISKMANKALILIPLVMLFFAILGATGVLINAVVAFIPLGLAVAEIMKLDRVSAMAFLYLGTYAGFNSSFMSARSRSRWPSCRFYPAWVSVSLSPRLSFSLRSSMLCATLSASAKIPPAPSCRFPSIRLTRTSPQK